jgi:hypothetical protein
MLVPSVFAAQEGKVLDLILKARDKYGVHIKLMEVQVKGDDCMLSASYPLFPAPTSRQDPIRKLKLDTNFWPQQ